MNTYIRKYTKNEELYRQRRRRLGIKRAIILCHESIVKEMQELARKRTQEIIGEDVHVSKAPNPEFENNHPMNGSVQSEKE